MSYLERKQWLKAEASRLQRTIVKIQEEIEIRRNPCECPWFLVRTNEKRIRVAEHQLAIYRTLLNDINERLKALVHG